MPKHPNAPGKTQSGTLSDWPQILLPYCSFLLAGKEAVEYIVGFSECSLIYMSSALWANLRDSLPALPGMRTIVYWGPEIEDTQVLPIPSPPLPMAGHAPGEGNRCIVLPQQLQEVFPFLPTTNSKEITSYFSISTVSTALLL